MENRLSEAARTGNVGALQKMLQENPLILADFALTSPYESPLHIATKARQLGFVQEIIKHNPEFASESNQDGFRPMDMASTFGYVEIVTELQRAGPEICRLSGRDGKTALHYAAINGRVEVIDQLLSTCGASIKDVTYLGETALHLAVKFFKFEAFKRLIQWLEQLRMEEMVNRPDRDGNTVLHISVSRKQLESVELLLNSSNIISSSLELNAMNSSSLTAMDIMDIVTEGPSDIQLREVLQSAGALKACNINGISITTSLQQFPTNNNRTNQELLPLQEPSKDWFKYFKFQQQRDSPSDVRNTLLVVAALIATVTFQAGVNPPTRFASPAVTPAPPTPPPPPPLGVQPPTHPELIVPLLGAASGNLGFLSSQFLFLLANTLGLVASLGIIVYLTVGFPFQRELQISIYSMMFAYGFSIPDFQSHGGTHSLVFAIACALPVLSRWPPRWAKKAWRYWKNSSR
ncbi:Ankyrin repeat-containing protein BDA1 [Camellia lanceoleosa]|uniref:Ankyrin repeat-containing protein BDA1 n=1 Tax=Camellia lanceoleosa TaxID=1840588 RepID=A0ACC0IDB0_9ERIC|nr:Ankyrin repeat-containing protein BDA1 [Camellia lanceoleosa]